MRSTQPLTIGIIGGGFTGTLMAVQLLQRCRRGDTVLLFERHQNFGRGLAYATGNPDHLLNVRAGNMSAYPDRPDHFVEWLEQRASNPGDARPTRDSFVSRRTYGEYVQSLLSAMLWQNEAGSNLGLVRDEVVAVDDEPDGVLVTVANGHTYKLERVVLATGNLPPDGSVGAYRGDPWGPETCEGVPPDQPVLLIGSGLTMVDIVLSLLRAGHRAPIHTLSRRGLIPQSHAATEALTIDAAELPQAATLGDLTRWVRRRVREAAQDGIGWHAVMDGLRPHIPTLWTKLAMADRRRFLRHLRPYWDIHRHRLAPEVVATIQAAIARGQLRVAAGRILGVEPEAQRVTVTFQRRRADEPETARFARVINCSGPATNYAASRDHLLRYLLDAGLARPDPLRLGLDVTPGGALIDADGQPSGRLFAAGPVTRGVFWECIAVPDIRLHCTRLAQELLGGWATGKPLDPSAELDPAPASLGKATAPILVPAGIAAG